MLLSMETVMSLYGLPKSLHKRFLWKIVIAYKGFTNQNNITTSANLIKSDNPCAAFRLRFYLNTAATSGN